VSIFFRTMLAGFEGTALPSPAFNPHEGFAAGNGMHEMHEGFQNSNGFPGMNGFNGGSYGPRDFSKGGKGFGKGKGKGGGKGKGRGGKNNFRSQAPSVPLFEEGTKMEEITATSFEELGIDPRLCELLARNGFMAPFPIQSLCIPEAIAGKDVCGKAKTGSGKTLAFGLPLLQMLQPTREKGFPSALILVPTRELALQVHQVLSNLRGPLTIEVAYGGSENRKFQVNTLLRKPVDILAACPGRLIDFCEAGIISLSHITHLVLDEADRMAEMGFQEQVDDILRRIGDDRPRQTMLFSATLDSSVDQLVKRHMNQPVHHQVAEKNVTVDLMTHRFIQVAHGRDKMAICAALCCLPGLEKVLVFVRTKLGVDDLTASLKHNYRIRALSIHGDKTQTARERTLQAFDKGDLHVLVATDVAARGLDIRRVDFVINYDSPEGADGHKIYLHRSGRTARAGKSGLVATLATRGDQEQDVEVIRRRLHIRDPPHRITLKDIANLADVLGLQQFLADFNEGRRLDPRIEQSNQRILREIEEGTTHPMIGMGGFGAEGTSYKGGGKGKGKGQSNFATSNGFVAQQGFAGAQANPADMYSFSPDFAQQVQVGGPGSAANGGAACVPLGVPSGALGGVPTPTAAGKGGLGKGASAAPTSAFGNFSAAGQPRGPGIASAAPAYSNGIPNGNPAASPTPQATFNQPYGGFMGALPPSTSWKGGAAAGARPPFIQGQPQQALGAANPYALLAANAADGQFAARGPQGPQFMAGAPAFGTAFASFGVAPQAFNAAGGYANAPPMYALGAMPGGMTYSPAAGAPYVPDASSMYQPTNMSPEGGGY